MRSELDQIVLIERYLAGELKGEELTSFEAELATNEELKSAVQTQRLLQRAVQRQAIKADLMKAQKGFKFKKTMKWLGGIGGAVITVAVASYLVMSNINVEGEHEFQPGQELEIPVEKSIPEAIDSIFEEKEIDTSGTIQNSEVNALDLIDSVASDESEGGIAKIITVDGKALSLTDEEVNVKEEIHGEIFASNQATAGPVGIATPIDVLDHTIEKDLQMEDSCATEEDDPFSLKEFQVQEVQYRIDPTKDTLIQVKQGIELFIPAFAYGEKSKTPFKLMVKAYAHPAELVMGQITTRANNTVLQHFGLIKVNAYRGDKKLSPRLNRKIVLAMNSFDTKEDVRMFTGRFQLKDSNRDMIVEKQEIDSSRTQTADSSRFQYNTETITTWSVNGEEGGGFYWNMSNMSYALGYKLPYYMTRSLGEKEREQVTKTTLKSLIGLNSNMEGDFLSKSRKFGISPIWTNEYKKATKLYPEKSSTPATFYYLRMLDQYHLPTGKVSFLLSGQNESHSFKLSGVEEATDYEVLFMKKMESFTDWKTYKKSFITSTSNVSGADLPRKKVGVIDLDYRLYEEESMYASRIKFVKKKLNSPASSRHLFFDTQQSGWMTFGKVPSQTVNTEMMNVSGTDPKAYTTIFVDGTMGCIAPKANTGFRVTFDRVPMKSKLKIVSVKEVDGKVYLSVTPLIGSRPAVRINTYKEVTREQFNAMLLNGGNTRNITANED